MLQTSKIRRTQYLIMEFGNQALYLWNRIYWNCVFKLLIKSCVISIMTVTPNRGCYILYKFLDGVYTNFSFFFFFIAISKYEKTQRLKTRECSLTSGFATKNKYYMWFFHLKYKFWASQFVKYKTSQTW